MRFGIELPIEPARVPEALAELRREGRQRRAEKTTQIAQMDAESGAPLITTIRWTRVEDGLPPYGVTVAVWMPKINTPFPRNSARA